MGLTCNYYFAYGSNLNHRHMSFRCPSAKFIAPMTVHNWKLVFRGVADIERCEGSKVIGGLWKITARCELALDGYEGYPYLYGKGVMQTDIAGSTHDVLTYIMVEHDCVKPPSDSYLNCIAEGYKDCGLPKQQLTNAVKDSYTDRTGQPIAGFSWGIPRPKGV